MYSRQPSPLVLRQNKTASLGQQSQSLTYAPIRICVFSLAGFDHRCLSGFVTSV